MTYTPKDILGFRSEIIDGVRQLTQLRLLEQVVEPDGKYGDKIINRSECWKEVDMRFIEKMTKRMNISYLMKVK